MKTQARSSEDLCNLLETVRNDRSKHASPRFAVTHQLRYGGFLKRSALAFHVSQNRLQYLYKGSISRCCLQPDLVVARLRQLLRNAEVRQRSNQRGEVLLGRAPDCRRLLPTTQ